MQYAEHFSTAAVALRSATGVTLPAGVLAGCGWLVDGFSFVSLLQPTGNRSKMDKLVRVRRLLQRLDFLFQLPHKLEEAVQEGQYCKAIRYNSSRMKYTG